MAYPEYKEMVEPLLCFIYFNGDQNFTVRSSDTYEPLADFFKLTKQERIQPRHDNGQGKEWDNKVQWIRQKLVTAGELYSVAVSRKGFWR